MIGGVAYTATHINLSRFDNELRFRGQAHDDLTAVLNDPKVQAGLRCGPLTGPNHKIVPDSRWIAEPRRRPGRARAPRATATTATCPCRPRASPSSSPRRFAIFKHAWTDVADDPRIQVPSAGLQARQDDSRFYSAYVRC